MKKKIAKGSLSYFTKRLNAAFRELRNLGYFAEQNFWCCQSCAWNALSDTEVDKAVFYHQQDADDIPYGYVYLAWSGDGREIVREFQKVGLFVQWDGDEKKRILVKYALDISE